MQNYVFIFLMMKNVDDNRVLDNNKLYIDRKSLIIYNISKENKEIQGGNFMDIAKMSSKGQITIPISIRQALKLKAGDKIVIQEENGRFYFDNAALVAFARIEKEFQGAASEAGFSSEEDMQEYMQGIRKKVRGY